MNFDQLVPIGTKRIDPISKLEFTFRIAPPVDLTTLRLATGTEAKEFLLVFCWQVMAGGWDIEKFPELRSQTSAVLPILKEAILSVNLHYTDADETSKPGDIFKYYITLTSVEPNALLADDLATLPSPELLDLLNKEVLNSQVLEIAMAWYIDVNKEELDKLSLEQKNSESSGEALEQPNPRTNRLFPNSKSLESNQWGSPKFLSDNLSRVVRNANRTNAIKQYESSGDHARSKKTVYKVQNRKDETEFIFDRERLAINTAEQFADKLMKLKDAKVLQTFFALMKWANIQDSPVFHDVPVSEVMSLVLKANGENKFNTPKRREFSEILEFLASMSITVTQIGEQVNKKTGKGKPVLREEKGVKIFRLEATYSVKKEYQSIPKESLREDLHFDRSVIKSFSGELLPGKSHLFGERASVYFDSLLHLDANKDSKAIVMGFQLQTRFNQFIDKEHFIELDRAFLIDLCDYSKTDNQKAAVATQQLKNNLDKLIKAGIISKYSGLTNNNADKIKIVPPKLPKLKEVD